MDYTTHAAHRRTSTLRAPTPPYMHPTLTPTPTRRLILGGAMFTLAPSHPFPTPRPSHHGVHSISRGLHLPRQWHTPTPLPVPIPQSILQPTTTDHLPPPTSAYHHPPLPPPTLQSITTDHLPPPTNTHHPTLPPSTSPIPPSTSHHLQPAYTNIHHPPLPPSTSHHLPPTYHQRQPRRRDETSNAYAEAHTGGDHVNARTLSPRHALLITASILSVAGSISPANGALTPLYQYQYINQSFHPPKPNYHYGPAWLNPPSQTTYHHPPTPTSTHHYLQPPQTTYHQPPTPTPTTTHHYLHTTTCLTFGTKDRKSWSKFQPVFSSSCWKLEGAIFQLLEGNMVATKATPMAHKTTNLVPRNVTMEQTEPTGTKTVPQR